jgi:hypothetical protein
MNAISKHVSPNAFSPFFCSRPNSPTLYLRIIPRGSGAADASKRIEIALRQSFGTAIARADNQEAKSAATMALTRLLSQLNLIEDIWREGAYGNWEEDRHRSMQPPCGILLTQTSHPDYGPS